MRAVLPPAGAATLPAGVEVRARDKFARALARWMARHPVPVARKGGPALVLASGAILWRPLEAVGERWTAQQRTWIPVLAERERVLVGPVFAPGRDSGCMRCLRVRYEAGFADGPHRSALEALERALEASGHDRDDPCGDDMVPVEAGGSRAGDGGTDRAASSTGAWSHWSVAHAGACALSLLREHARGDAPALIVSDLAEASVRRMRLLALHDCDCRTLARPGTAYLERAFATDTGGIADGRD